MELVGEVYALCKHLPNEEKYGLQSQIKRCVISIPSNIAEGKMRSTRKDFANFLHNSLGSSAELETQLILVDKLFNISTKNTLELNVEIQKMLFTLISKLKPKN